MAGTRRGRADPGKVERAGKGAGGAKGDAIWGGTGTETKAARSGRNGPIRGGGPSPGAGPGGGCRRQRRLWGGVLALGAEAADDLVDGVVVIVGGAPPPAGGLGGAIPIGKGGGIGLVHGAVELAAPSAEPA